ncbi:MAG: AIR carboxylase family protein, partial [Candidatus Bathyarchaeota archaeon]
MKKVQVAVILGSESDRPIAEKTVKILEKLGVIFETKVLSAHRMPKQLEKYLDSAGADVFIAIAGMAAHLP